VRVHVTADRIQSVSESGTPGRPRLRNRGTLGLDPERQGGNEIHGMNMGSEPERKRLFDRLREASVRDILAAAEEVFAERGLEQASMAQIAERAGVAVGTLYNRFADREALLDALLTERRAELLENLDASLGAHAEAGFRTALVGFLTSMFAHCDAHRPFLRLVFANPPGWKKREDVSRALFERMQALVKRGQREKVLRRDAEGSFPVLLMWGAKAMLHRETHGLPPLAPAAAAESLVSFFLNGTAR
jgi:AcrR family transcriptional regulator